VVGRSRCDVAIIGPLDQCPEAFDDGSEGLRASGGALVGVGAGVALAELLVPRRAPGWVPWLVGSVLGGVAGSVLAAKL